MGKLNSRLEIGLAMETSTFLDFSSFKIRFPENIGHGIRSNMVSITI